MALRLTHVLGAMTVVLLAGVLSVWHLEQRLGGATVPGIVVVEAAWLEAGALADLAAQHGEARSGWVDAGAALLSPFEEPLVARLRRRGDITFLYLVDAQVDRDDLQDDGSVWGNVLDSFERVTGIRQAVELAAVLVRGQSGTRAFLVGLALGDEPPPQDAATLVATLEDALGELPSFRRSALVVLGARDEQTGRRPYLRLDLGAWKNRARPGLADLLDPGW